MDKVDVVCVYSGILCSHEKGVKTEPFVVMWVNPEPVILSEIGQKEKNRYPILTQVYGIWKKKWY